MKKILLFFLLLIEFSAFTQEVVIAIGRPPETYRAPVYNVDESQGDVVLQNVPTYYWSHGCSSTSAAMLIGYYDWNNYTNMYTGPSTNGLNCAPTNEFNWWDQDHCSISATAQTFDGLVNRGHVDDYYITLGNLGPDPFIVNNWTEHVWGQCVGDYMGTSQSYFQAPDGGTFFVLQIPGIEDNSPVHDATFYENLTKPYRDGCHGLRLFCENRGYAVENNYSQVISGTGGSSIGFTFSQYKNEINKNRPVLIQVQGHTMIGYGYNNTNNKIILHDTWDWSAHTMSWGGSYYDMQHLGVTVLELKKVYGGVNDWVEISNGPESLNIGDNFSYDGLFHSFEGDSHPENWNWKIVLNHDNGEYILAQTNTNNQSMYNTFNGTVPSAIPSYSWIRDIEGDIAGKVIVTVLDSDGYLHEDELNLSFKYGPQRPHLMGGKYDDNSLYLSYYSPGAVNYKVHYDTDSGYPYSGTGAQQGNSPINANNLTTVAINGLQLCEDYYFAIVGENTSGSSDYSNEEIVPILSPNNNLPTNYMFNSISIRYDNQFTENYYFSNNLIIEPGVTLNVDGGVLYFGENSGIIIKQGGKLILDGTICTSACGEIWQGIQVWGDYNESQRADANGDYKQGYLELNNAIIENAETAISLFKEGTWSTYSGGIIKANDSKFINNTKAIHFHPYKNMIVLGNDPAFEADNEAVFNNCEFDINEDYFSGSEFFKHADLVQVRGIDFVQCDFKRSSTANTSDLCSGIAAYDAGVSVRDSRGTPSTFEGFYCGIQLNNNNAIVNYDSYIKNSIFTNNSYGIKLNTMTNMVSIKDNTFHVGYNSPDKAICLASQSYGIHLNNSNTFVIEDNTFDKYSGAPSDGDYVGIEAYNTQTSADEIFRNTFSGLTHANHAENKNWTGSAAYGLEYYCNQHSSNNNDLFFVYDGAGNLLNSGVQESQGNQYQSTGNTFTQNVSGYNLYNNTGHDVDYYYNVADATEIPFGYTSSTINPHPQILTAECSDGGIGTDIKGLTSTEKQDLENEYTTSESNYTAVESLLVSLEDGGNTLALKSEVSTSWPDDMWELRAELLGLSPYLTTEVLKTAADKTEVLPESVLFEILSANPDELKKSELMDYLENKEQPLPEYMISILEQLSEGLTAKTAMQGDMSRYSREKNRAAKQMLVGLNFDKNFSFIDYRVWMGRLGGMKNDMNIVASFVQEENYTDALALANLIPDLYELDTEELEEHNYYMEMLDLNISLKQQNRSMLDLNPGEYEDLLQLAENSKGVAGVKAKGILEHFYGEHFCNCITTDVDDNKSANTTFTSGEFAEAMGLKISAEPNPATTWVAFDYELPIASERAELIIKSIDGKQVAHFNLTGETGQKVWDTRSLKAGTYIYEFISGELKQSGKIIITK